MTPEAGRDKEKMRGGGKMQNLRAITCSGVSQNAKRGVMNDPKPITNQKIGGHFAKCALMTTCPPLMQHGSKTCNTVTS